MSNSLIINELYLKICVVLTGGLEVSFSILVDCSDRLNKFKTF